MMKNLFPFLLVFLVLGFGSCSSDESSSARLRVVLVDAPASYDEVNVEVEAVNVKFGQSDAEEGESGWTDISDFEPQVFNLLDLTNGSEEVLADLEVGAGILGEVRLVLGDDNTLVIGDQTMSLTVPSGSSSGLKIKLNTELKAGITYTLVLDFDAAQSIVSTGSGKYNLKPVVHAHMDALTGAISGTISPADFGVVVYAIQGEDSVSTYPNESGQFLLSALEAGTYDVAAVPEDENTTISVENVEVVIGDITDAGNISFE